MKKVICVLCALLLVVPLAACGAPAAPLPEESAAEVSSEAEVSSVPEASSAPAVSSAPEVSSAPAVSSAPEVSSVAEASSAPAVSSAPEVSSVAAPASANEPAPTAEAAEPESSSADEEETDEDAEWFLDRAKREIAKYGYKVVPGDDFKSTFLKVKVDAGDRRAGLRAIINELTMQSMRNALPAPTDPITGEDIETEEAPTEVQVTIKKSGSSYTIYYKYDK